jgi:hypothetical protein
MGPERHLHVVDAHGQVDESSAIVPENYALLLEDHMKTLRELAAAKGRITQLCASDPQAETINAALTYWKARCHGPASRVQIPLDGARATAVKRTLKRLIESDPDPLLSSTTKAERAAAVGDATNRALRRIKGAIDAAAAFPFEGKYGVRFAEQVPGSKRKVDIVYILRDEVKMEQFERLHEGDEKREAYRAELHRRLTTRPNELLWFASLNPEYGELIARAVRWAQTQVQA